MQRKSLLKVTALSMILTLVFSTSVLGAVYPGSVALSPNQAGAIVELTVSFRLGAEDGLAEQAGDSITLIFDNRFSLPTSISSSRVLVNGLDAKAVKVDRGAGRIQVVVPEDLAGGEEVTIIFLVTAGLRNPEVTGKYDIGVITSRENQVLWMPCEIIGKPLTNLRLSVDPDSAGLNAAYTIRFTAPANLLLGQDSIKVTFPSGTTVPKNIDGKWIKVNNHTLSISPSVVGRTLSLPIPVSVGAGKEVTVAIDSSAGIRNPIVSGDYSLTVQTSKDTGAGAWYRVSSGIGQPNVTINPAIADSTARYTIGFTTGPTGSLMGGQDQITIAFPRGTYLPASIPVSSIKVNGVAVNIGTVSKAGNAITFYLPAQVNVGASKPVNVVIETSAGIQNPEAGSYTLSVYTTADQTAVTSRSYTVIGSSISQPTVTVDPDTAWADAKYTIKFNTGSAGALVGGKDTITVVFPKGTAVPSRISTSHIRVNNTAVNVGSVTRSGNSITFTVPSRLNISPSRSVTVVIDQAAGIKNPGPDTYTLSAYTSADPNPVTSRKYTIAGGSVSEVSVTVNPPVIDRPAGYEISFKTSAGGSLEGDSDTITVTFPRGTTVPDSFSRSDISVNGYTLSSRSISVSGRKVTFRVPSKVTVANNRKVTVALKDTAGIINPDSAGDYRLEVATSKDSTAETSERYTILGGNIEGVAVNVSPNRQGEAAAYNVSFRTSSSGALTGGQDTITLTFPYGTYLPSTVSPGHITVNGSAVDRSGVTVDGRSLTLRVPKGLTVRNKAAVTVNVSTAAGIRNPSTPSNYFLSVATSRDPISSQSLYVIKQEQVIRIRIDDKVALVNGRQLIMDVPPTIISSRTMVPLRFIGDAFGARTDYNANTKGITITLGNTVIRLTVNSKTAMIGSQRVILDSPATVIRGRTLVPTRFISEAFGAKVDWLPETKTVLIVK